MSPKVGLRGMQLNIPTIRSETEWTPASIPNLFGWWDASDLTTLFQDSAGTTPVTANADPVGRMSDKSGNNRHMIQPTSGARPTYVSATKGVVGDGSADFLLSIFTAVTLTAQTTFLVFDPKSVINLERYFSQTNGTTADASVTGNYVPIMRSFANNSVASWHNAGLRSIVAVTTRVIFMSLHTGAVLTNRANRGTAENYTNALNLTVDRMALLNAINTLPVSSNAEINDAITYNRALTTDEQNLVWEYLSLKWGITIA